MEIHELQPLYELVQSLNDRKRSRWPLQEDLTWQDLKHMEYQLQKELPWKYFENYVNFLLYALRLLIETKWDLHLIEWDDEIENDKLYVSFQDEQRMVPVNYEFDGNWWVGRIGYTDDDFNDSDYDTLPIHSHFNHQDFRSQLKSNNYQVKSFIINFLIT